MRGVVLVGLCSYLFWKTQGNTPTHTHTTQHNTHTTHNTQHTPHKQHTQHRMVRSNSIEPRMVALLPQEELLEEGTDAQVQPPGLTLVFLPFADEIRAPETDLSFVGPDSWQQRYEQMMMIVNLRIVIVMVIMVVLLISCEVGYMALCEGDIPYVTH